MSFGYIRAVSRIGRPMVIKLKSGASHCLGRNDSIGLRRRAKEASDIRTRRP